MSIKLGKVERVDLRNAWLNEAQHFTPWLASDEGIELLQEALGMELEVEAVEKFVGPFKADILAKRLDGTDDHWVLIENQLERTDHRHLGQLLTYSAGLKAVTVVWIAESFAEEHRAALNWLNDVTSDDLEFFGLEIELWRIGASELAPMFNVVAEPNEWSREIKQKSEGGTSDLKLQQQRFWQELRAKLLEAKSKVRPQKAHAQHWADYAVGRAGTWLSATVNKGKKYVSVEFNFRGPPGKIWYDQLEFSKSAIDSKFPGLSWQRLDGRKQARVALYREDSDPTDESTWPSLHAWLLENLAAFYELFRPYALAFTGDHDAGSAGQIDQIASEPDES
jgi:Domain of unknown function (DUF4268)